MVIKRIYLADTILYRVSAIISVYSDTLLHVSSLQSPKYKSIAVNISIAIKMIGNNFTR